MGKFVIRARYVQPDGVGWVSAAGTITSNLVQAKVYDSEAAAWDHLISVQDLLGNDETGDFCWVEPIPWVNGRSD